MKFQAQLVCVNCPTYPARTGDQTGPNQFAEALAPPPHGGAVDRVFCPLTGGNAFASLLGKVSLPAKLDIIAELADEIAAQALSIFFGNAVLASTPGGGGMRAGEKMRAKAEGNDLGAKRALAGVTPVDPVIEKDDSEPGQSEGKWIFLGVLAGRLKSSDRIVEVRSGRQSKRMAHK